MADSFTVDLGDSAAVSFQGAASVSALAFPVTGLIGAQDGVILTMDTPTILTRLTRIHMITRTHMTIRIHILTHTHMFIRTHTRMSIRILISTIV